MVGCSAIACSNPRRNANACIDSNRIEKKEVRWAIAVKKATATRSLWVPNVGSRVCKDHFITNTCVLQLIKSLHIHWCNCTRNKLPCRCAYLRYYGNVGEIYLSYETSAGLAPICMTKKNAKTSLKNKLTRSTQQVQSRLSWSNCASGRHTKQEVR